MRDILPVCLAAMLFVCLVAWFTYLTTRMREPPPIETTPKILDCDCDFFTGQRVKVRTGGMEMRDGELVFRRLSNTPPCVICRFNGAPPATIPTTVTGLCVGRQDGAVIVHGCRP